MTQKQAACTSMGEYLQRVKGKEQELQEAWEIARWEVFNQYRLSPFIKHPPHKVTDVATFPWEKQTERKITRKVARVSDGEKAALNAIFEDYYKRKYGEQAVN